VGRGSMGRRGWEGEGGHTVAASTWVLLVAPERATWPPALRVALVPSAFVVCTTGSKNTFNSVFYIHFFFYLRISLQITKNAKIKINSVRIPLLVAVREQVDHQPISDAT
jgi:hypothetical protein